MKQRWTELKEEIDKSIILVNNTDTFLTLTDRTTRKKHFKT